MDMAEFLKVKNYTYIEYCDYLQKKYGIGLADYMTKSFNANPKCKRTKEGLVAHHKMENTMIMLSTKEIAKRCQFEWQQKENIVYCDYLEHLLLHVLICKYPAIDKVDIVFVGIGGIINFIVPELNDLYSGWETKQNWRKNLHNVVVDSKDVYFRILEYFMEIEVYNPTFHIDMLCKSFNAKYGLWDDSYNAEIYSEIRRIWERIKGIRENEPNHII